MIARGEGKPERTRESAESDTCQSVAQAKSVALRLLARRSHSEAELHDKLVRRGFDPSVCTQVLSWARSLGYLDDLTLARRWVARSQAERRFGLRRVRLDLHQRGIHSAHIEQAIQEEWDSNDELPAARALVRSRYGEALAEPRVMRRAVSFLERRGFSPHVIRQVLPELRFHTSDGD